MFRGQKPGINLKLNTEDQDHAIVLWNSTLKIGEVTCDIGYFKYNFKPIDFQTAFSLYENIQERVVTECEKRVEETNSKIEKEHEDSFAIQQMFGGINEK